MYFIFYLANLFIFLHKHWFKMFLCIQLSKKTYIFWSWRWNLICGPDGCHPLSNDFCLAHGPPVEKPWNRKHLKTIILIMVMSYQTQPVFVSKLVQGNSERGFWLYFCALVCTPMKDIRWLMGTSWSVGSFMWP